jgi:hypothetical protein
MELSVKPFWFFFYTYYVGIGVISLLERPVQFSL